jgi:hypothetical protein
LLQWIEENHETSVRMVGARFELDTSLNIEALMKSKVMTKEGA